MIPPRRHLPSLPSPIPGAPHCGCDTLQCNSPVWKRDFSTSGGMATTQLKIPARPPAKRILGTLRSLTLWQDQSGVGGKSKKKMKKGKKIKLIVLTKVTIKKSLGGSQKAAQCCRDRVQYLSNLFKMDQLYPKDSNFFIQQHTHTCSGEKKKTNKPTNQPNPQIQQSPPAFCAHTGLKVKRPTLSTPYLANKIQTGS